MCETHKFCLIKFSFDYIILFETHDSNLIIVFVSIIRSDSICMFLIIAFVYCDSRQLQLDHYLQHNYLQQILVFIQ